MKSRKLSAYLVNLSKNSRFALIAVTAVVMFTGCSNDVTKFVSSAPDGSVVATQQVIVTSVMEYGSYETRTIRYYHVERVLMHELDWYTIFYSVSNSTELKSLDFRQQTPRIFTDVSDGEPMWILCKQSALNNSRFSILEIHLHSASEINGAGWNRKIGKSQTIHGMTTVIE